MANIVYDYEKRLPALSTKMTSKPLNIKGQVKKELAFWKGKKETSRGARARLSTYWDFINFGSWSPTGTPWSAAFVSYIMRGTGLKGAASHYKYIKNVVEGKSPGWKAFSIPKNIGKLVIQPGDILVKERSGGKYNTHGDVVASVSGNKAALVGGNVSNTAKVVGTVQLNNDGTIREAGKYQVLLKKNPVTTVQYGFSRVLAYGGFATAIGLTGVLAFMVAKRKGLISTGSKASSIIFYHLPTCPYCAKVRNYLDSQGIGYTLKDVSNPKIKRQMMKIRKDGKTTVPFLIVDGIQISDSERIIRYFKELV